MNCYGCVQAGLTAPAIAVAEDAAAIGTADELSAARRADHTVGASTGSRR